jgi:hypothetical protein
MLRTDPSLDEEIVKDPPCRFAIPIDAARPIAA